MKKINKDKGITLIVLVITIVVMLILVGVTISMAVNGGLFDYAGKAVRDTQNIINAEKEFTNGKIQVDGKLYASIGDYLEGKELIEKVNVYIHGNHLDIKKGLTWREFLSSVKSDMEEYEISFASTNSQDYINYSEALKIWYKNFVKKEAEDSGEYVGWYRIIQGFVFENCNFERGQIVGLTEEELNTGNLENIVLINEEKLDEEIDTNLIYMFSYDS